MMSAAGPVFRSASTSAAHTHLFLFDAVASCWICGGGERLMTSSIFARWTGSETDSWVGPLLLPLGTVTLELS